MEKLAESSHEEDDFWEKFEKKPILLSQKKKKTEKKNDEPHKTTRTLKNPHAPAALQDFQIDWNREKLEKVASHIKDATTEELRTIGIIVKNQTKKEQLQTLLNIRQEFQMEVIELKKDQKKMQEENSLKTRLMITLQKYLEDQGEIEVIEPFYMEDNGKSEELNELRELVEKDFLKYEMAKILNSEFKAEAKSASRKVSQVDCEVNKIKTAHAAVKSALEKRFFQKEQAILDETLAIQDEFEMYKAKILQELEARTVVQQRQQEFIHNLIEELKNAKIILQNPTLRLKTYEKVKSLATPNNKSYLFPKIITSQTNTKFNSRLLTSPFEALSNRSVKFNKRAKSSLKP